jgi:S1-C subfamily serine protease
LTAPGLLLLLLLGPGAVARALQAHTNPPAAHPQPGYLGVSLLDLDQETATRLHLRDMHGALIFSVDRDAPAASAGLRARDVILEAGGQRIDNVDALRRKLRETTPGNTITLRISRDGAEQVLSVQLGNEAEIAERAWEKHFSAPGMAAGPGIASGTEPDDAPVTATAAAPDTTFAAPTGHGAGSTFLGHFAFNPLYTGAEIDPLSTQLADFFGVHDGAGLLVRSVNENSPASMAGLRAGDVILRVNNRPVVSREDWTRQLHANRGRTVQLAVMRNRHEQTMSMTAGSGKKH